MISIWEYDQSTQPSFSSAAHLRLIAAFESLRREIIVLRSKNEILLDQNESLRARLEQHGLLKSPDAHEAFITTECVRGQTKSKLEPIKPLTAYDLSTREGRQLFLWSLYHDFQEGGLLSATNHIWNCLAAPKAGRTQLMAAKLGLSGTGKIVVHRVLQLFLKETLAGLEVPDLPPRSTYPDFCSGSAECQKIFAAVESRYATIAAKYEAILDGRT